MWQSDLQGPYRTLGLETFMRLGVKHMENLVDPAGQTYFDVFMTRPAEAVHDWPDFVDLPSRYLEAAVMARQMLGVKVATEDLLKGRFLSTFETDELARRPETSYSRAGMYIGEQALALRTLNTLFMDNHETSIAERIEELVDGLNDLVSKVDDYALHGSPGNLGICFAVRPLVQSWILLGYPPALDLGGRLVRGLMEHSNEFGAEGNYSGHNHIHLGALAGVLSYALTTNNSELVARAVKCFDFAMSISTNFGFVPELPGRMDDLIACETCAIMDYLDVAILLARYGHPQYWDVVEKVTRNHLLESQIKDGSWLSKIPYREDTDRILYKDVGQKVIGAFAGWSSPNHLLAYEEEIGTSWNWCKDESQYPYYFGKIRALQNCCAGSGLRAIFQVWKNIAYFQGDDLYVNLHIDKRIPGLTMTGYQPYEGKIRLQIE